MKGLSPIISVVILVALSISLMSYVAPWMYNMVYKTTNSTGSEAQRQIMCRNAGLGLDDSYGSYGIDYNFSFNVSANETDWIKAKVVNTGTVNLYAFTFEVLIQNGTEEDIYHYGLTDSSERTAANPLYSAMSAILTANVTEDWNESTAVVREVKIINAVCPEVAPSIEL